MKKVGYPANSRAKAKRTNVLGNTRQGARHPLFFLAFSGWVVWVCPSLWWRGWGGVCWGKRGVGAFLGEGIWVFPFPLSFKTVPFPAGPFDFGLGVVEGVGYGLKDGRGGILNRVGGFQYIVSRSPWGVPFLPHPCGIRKCRWQSVQRCTCNGWTVTLWVHRRCRSPCVSTLLWCLRWHV